MSDPSRPRLPAVLILAIALAWLVAGAAAVVATGVDPAALAGPALARYAAALVLRLAPPLAMMLVAVEVLRRTGRGDDAALADLETRTAAAAAAGQAVRDGLLDINATLTAIGGRLGELRAATATETPRLAEAARTVEALTRTLATATGTEAARQLDEVETMLAGVFTRQHEVATEVAALRGATEAAAAAIDGRAAGLGEAVDAALARTGAALDHVRASVDAQAVTTLASIDAAKTGLDAIGGATATTVGRRIDHIVAASAALGGQLADHDAQTASLIATVERSFAVLDKRLGHAAAMGTATLDALHARMAAVRELADAVPPRLDAASAGLAAVEAAAARLAPATATATGLAQALAVSAAPAGRLAADLAAARADLAAIEEAAHGSALAAAGQLIEVLGRVRDVAGSAAGTLRDTLAGIVAEAEAALAEKGARTAAAAFADPIRHEIAGLEGAAALAGAAAQATADRIAARLLGLTAAVATVERRLAEVER